MRRTLITAAILLAACLSSPKFATPVLHAADDISGELVGLNVSLAAEKQLVVYDQLIAAEEWVAALDLLDRLTTDRRDLLVRVAPGRYVGLAVAIQQRLSQLPTAGLETYRRRHSLVTLALLARARLEHKEATLWRIAETFAATSAAQSANDDLAVATIADLFPDHRTLGVSARGIIMGGGSFHCSSQQLPA